MWLGVIYLAKTEYVSILSIIKMITNFSLNRYMILLHNQTVLNMPYFYILKIVNTA